MTVITRRPFGYTKDGKPVTAFTLRNGSDMAVTILDMGATIQSIVLPDKNGVPTDVVLGYEDVSSYEEGSCFYGAVVGRLANRLKGGHFVLDGKEYQLEKNSPNGTNHIHGVFPHRIFDAEIRQEALVLRYRSPAFEEGIPGNLDLTVTYRLSEDNALSLDYKAVTDAPTIVNLTNHCYFNLNGQNGSTVLNHKVRLHAIAYTEYEPEFAPTGRIISVKGTPLDFHQEHTIGERFDDPYHQFRICTGYDHNMILEGEAGELKPIGTASSDVTGITLEAFTTEPAFQFYSANFIQYDPVPFGKRGIRYPKNGGLCFEAQHYPDAINQPHFPNTVLRPGETYRQTTIYRLK